MPGFTVGPGVLAAMAEAGDEPRSDETYVQPGISETFGKLGIYYYLEADNETKRLPFEVG